MKQNIGQKLALYPTPATVVGTVGEDGKVNWMLKPDYSKLKPVLFEMPTYKYLRTGDIIGDCVKMGKAYGETLK